MPMRFTDLARDTKSAVLDLGDGDTIRFEFRHGLLTPQFLHTLLALDDSQMTSANAKQQEAAITAISEQVVRLVTEWDLLDADGVTMFPLTVERLSCDIPIRLQYNLLQQCLREVAQGESSAPGGNGSVKQPPSGATSSRRASSARRRSGTRS